MTPEDEQLAQEAMRQINLSNVMELSQRFGAIGSEYTDFEILMVSAAILIGILKSLPKEDREIGGILMEHIIDSIRIQVYSQWDQKDNADKKEWLN